MKIKPSDIKITTPREAQEYLNEIFVGVASKYSYCKPSPDSMSVIIYTIKKDTIILGSAILHELHNAKSHDVRYELDSVTLHYEIEIPTDVEKILTALKALIEPIFDAVKLADIECAMKSYLKAAKPKIEW